MYSQGTSSPGDGQSVSKGPLDRLYDFFDLRNSLPRWQHVIFYILLLLNTVVTISALLLGGPYSWLTWFSWMVSTVAIDATGFFFGISIFAALKQTLQQRPVLALLATLVILAIIATVVTGLILTSPITAPLLTVSFLLSPLGQLALAGLVSLFATFFAAIVATVQGFRNRNNPSPAALEQKKAAAKAAAQHEQTEAAQSDKQQALTHEHTSTAKVKGHPPPTVESQVVLQSPTVPTFSATHSSKSGSTPVPQAAPASSPAPVVQVAAVVPAPLNPSPASPSSPASAQIPTAPSSPLSPPVTIPAASISSPLPQVAITTPEVIAAVSPANRVLIVKNEHIKGEDAKLKAIGFEIRTIGDELELKIPDAKVGVLSIEEHEPKDEGEPIRRIAYFNGRPLVTVEITADAARSITRARPNLITIKRALEVTEFATTITKPDGFVLIPKAEEAEFITAVHNAIMRKKEDEEEEINPPQITPLLAEKLLREQIKEQAETKSPRIQILEVAFERSDAGDQVSYKIPASYGVQAAYVYAETKFDQRKLHHAIAPKMEESKRAVKKEPKKVNTIRVPIAPREDQYLDAIRQGHVSREAASHLLYNVVKRYEAHYFKKHHQKIFVTLEIDGDGWLKFSLRSPDPQLHPEIDQKEEDQFANWLLELGIEVVRAKKPGRLFNVNDEKWAINAVQDQEVRGKPQTYATAKERIKQFVAKTKTIFSEINGKKITTHTPAAEEKSPKAEDELLLNIFRERGIMFVAPSRDNPGGYRDVKGPLEYKSQLLLEAIEKYILDQPEAKAITKEAKAKLSKAKEDFDRKMQVLEVLDNDLKKPETDKAKIACEIAALEKECEAVLRDWSNILINDLAQALPTQEQLKRSKAKLDAASEPSWVLALREDKAQKLAWLWFQDRPGVQGLLSGMFRDPNRNEEFLVFKDRIHIPKQPDFNVSVRMDLSATMAEKDAPGRFTHAENCKRVAEGIFLEHQDDSKNFSLAIAGTVVQERTVAGSTVLEDQSKEVLSIDAMTPGAKEKVATCLNSLTPGGEPALCSSFIKDCRSIQAGKINYFYYLSTGKTEKYEKPKAGPLLEYWREIAAEDVNELKGLEALLRKKTISTETKTGEEEWSNMDQENFIEGVNAFNLKLKAKDAPYLYDFDSKQLVFNFTPICKREVAKLQERNIHLNNVMFRFCGFGNAFETDPKDVTATTLRYGSPSDDLARATGAQINAVGNQRFKTLIAVPKSTAVEQAIALTVASAPPSWAKARIYVNPTLSNTNPPKVLQSEHALEVPVEINKEVTLPYEIPKKFFFNEFGDVREDAFVLIEIDDGQVVHHIRHSVFPEALQEAMADKTPAQAEALVLDIQGVIERNVIIKLASQRIYLENLDKQFCEGGYADRLHEVARVRTELLTYLEHYKKLSAESPSFDLYKTTVAMLQASYDRLDKAEGTIKSLQLEAGLKQRQAELIAKRLHLLEDKNKEQEAIEELIVEIEEITENLIKLEADTELDRLHEACIKAQKPLAAAAAAEEKAREKLGFLAPSSRYGANFHEELKRLAVIRLEHSKEPAPPPKIKSRYRFQAIPERRAKEHAARYQEYKEEFQACKKVADEVLALYNQEVVRREYKLNLLRLAAERGEDKAGLDQSKDKKVKEKKKHDSKRTSLESNIAELDTQIQALQDQINELGEQDVIVPSVVPQGSESPLEKLIKSMAQNLAECCKVELTPVTSATVAVPEVVVDLDSVTKPKPARRKPTPAELLAEREAAVEKATAELKEWKHEVTQRLCKLEDIGEQIRQERNGSPLHKAIIGNVEDYSYYTQAAGLLCGAQVACQGVKSGFAGHGNGIADYFASCFESFGKVAVAAGISTFMAPVTSGLAFLIRGIDIPQRNQAVARLTDFFNCAEKPEEFLRQFARILTVARHGQIATPPCKPGLLQRIKAFASDFREWITAEGNAPKQKQAREDWEKIIKAILETPLALPISEEKMKHFMLSVLFSEAEITKILADVNTWNTPSAVVTPAPAAIAIPIPVQKEQNSSDAWKEQRTQKQENGIGLAAHLGKFEPSSHDIRVESSTVGFAHTVVPFVEASGFNC